MIFLAVSDTRQSMLPDVLVSLPNLVESGGETLSPRSLLSSIGIVAEVPPAPVAVPGAPAAEAAKETRPVPAFDADLIPEADAIRPLLFPSVSALAVDDQGIRFISRESFPTINPATAVPVAIAMLVPAAHASRVAAQRAKSVNNLKQIGVAMQSFANANKHFPTDVRGKDGKPLLSWRVQMLPSIEQETLFKEFKLDEPWDSPHNKALVDRMPAVFAIPGSPAESGMTFYRGFSGKGALFDPAVSQGVELAKITDGVSNTIAVVEAREAVPWTRPDSDIRFDAEAKKPEAIKALVEALGGHSSGGFNALLCDGSVRFLRESINPATLRLLITRDGGEVVSSD
jgi:prepilin-type processing-associated H-X9-DG protein